MGILIINESENYLDSELILKTNIPNIDHS